MYNIGNLIYEIREKRLMSRAELAEGICSKKYIYMIENGERSPSIQILLGISKKLHFNFFDTISYLENESPLKFKEIIGKYIKLRIEGNKKNIIEYSEALKKMTLYMRPEVKQLVTFHDIYLRMINGLTSAEDIKIAEDNLSKTCVYSVGELDLSIHITYTELLLLAIVELCKFKYYDEFNIPRLERLYELSKSLIKKDEAIDTSLIILRGLFEAYDKFKLTEKKQIIKDDFKKLYLDHLGKSLGGFDLYAIKSLISANVDIFSDKTIECKDEFNELYFTIHLIKPNNIIYVPQSGHSEVFRKGHFLAFDVLEDLLPEGEDYNLIVDFKEFISETKNLEFYQFADPDLIINYKLNWEDRIETYFVLPKINNTLLGILIYQNEVFGKMSNYNPIAVDTVYDAMTLMLGNNE